ncbi:MAG: glycosyltransferase [Deltaproteobacteria bacterium RIFOXYD12_FULL_50_9]|nr:MAG: glycosyltransferase [Deltaproteobacteria bacterium RIFOXYD12_FULL_50_9]
MHSVTVIIVNWNSGTLLAKCLQHLERQTFFPLRVFVVDNASTDNSAACAEGFSNVTLLRMAANHGFAGGNNVALAQCETEFVALLNPDAFPEPDWLESLLMAASAHSEVAAFGSRQLCDETPGILDGIGDSYLISGRVLRARFGELQQTNDLIEKEIFSPCAAAALYRRQALVDIGGFDEDYFCYVEDVDLGFRLHLAGHKAMYVPEAVVRHVGSATTGGQHSDFAVYYGHRNLVWTFIKNMPGILFLLLLPLHGLLNLASIIWFALQGRGGVIGRAKRDALLDLPKMWRKRQRIQKSRVASIGEIWRLLDKRIVTTKFGRKDI